MFSCVRGSILALMAMALGAPAQAVHWSVGHRGKIRRTELDCSALA